MQNDIRLKDGTLLPGIGMGTWYLGDSLSTRQQAIPRSGKKEHVLANWEVRDLVLAKEDLKTMDRCFPAPARRVPLDIV